MMGSGDFIPYIRTDKRFENVGFKMIHKILLIAISLDFSKSDRAEENTDE
jgi:hypothetical protein